MKELIKDVVRNNPDLSSEISNGNHKALNSFIPIVLKSNPALDPKKIMSALREEFNIPEPQKKKVVLSSKENEKSFKAWHEQINEPYKNDKGEYCSPSKVMLTLVFNPYSHEDITHIQEIADNEIKRIVKLYENNLIEI